MKYRSEYIYRSRWGRPEHTWTVLGSRGAIHLHIMDHGEKHQQEYGERYSGGIEFHYRTPPEYMQDDPPTNDECWLLKCPCWHDGSSLQASEFWIPRWQANPNDHDGLLRSLECRADEEFSRTVEGDK